MKKKQLCALSIFLERHKKFYLIMWNFVILFFTLSLSTIANVNSQELYDLELRNKTLVESLLEVQENSGYGFLYNGSELKEVKGISMKIENKNIEDILDLLLVENGFSYRIKNETILVQKISEVKTIQQEKEKMVEITGIITGTNGETIPGVSIMAKGTTYGIVSSIDGSYTLKVPAATKTLQFSFVGMKTVEIAINNQTKIDVVMQEDAIGLEEIVAIGYGVTKKSDLTGAVGSVKSDELSQSATSSVMHMLSGKVAGLQVQQKSAQPGGGVSVYVRGSGSTGAGNDPLYVIDGFPVSNSSVEPNGSYSYGSRNPLNSINPNDIESIEVLKDASASAIYGARAANGVILITTKNAKKGKMEVEYSFTYGLQAPKSDFDLLEGQELMETWNHGYREHYRYKNNYYPYGDKGVAPDDEITKFFTEEEIAAAKNFNYEDMVTRTGQIQEHNVIVKSGTDKTKVYTSFNYYDQKGMLKNLNFTRYSGRINVMHNLTDKLSLSTHTTASYIKNSNSQMGGINDGSGMIASAFQFPSFIEPKDENGNYNLNDQRPTIPNPISFMDVTDVTHTYRLLTSVSANYQISKWLSTKIKYGADLNLGRRKSYLPKTFLYGANLKGSANISERMKGNQLFEMTATVNKDFDNLNVSGVVGYSQERYTSEDLSARNNDFITDQFLYNKLEAGQAERPGVGSGYGITKYRSYFSRLQLNWMSKYLLTLTMRGDGSDKFGENNKWGYFPSAALAWRIIEEPFLKSNDVISDLKLRTSYGQIGNANIGGNAFAYYSVGSEYTFGNKVVKGVEQTSLGNPDLKWETTTEINLGLDFGLFDNRVHGTFEIYQKTIDDLLSKRSLASYLPVEKVAANIGSTQSSGWEFSLETQNLRGKLKWNTTLSLSHYKDRWKTRNPEVILSVYEKEDDPLWGYYKYISDGILQIGEEYPANSSLIPGEIKVKDINGLDEDGNLTGKPDGKISAADRVLVGTKQPNLNFGLNNTFTYKNWDLSFYIYGMLDRMIEDTNRRNLGILTRENNTTGLTYDAWSSENTDGTLPSGIKQTYSGNSDFYLTNVDFVRLKNVTIGYTFNNLLKRNKLAQKARIYVDFNNLGVLTNYKGGDPETDSWAAYPFPFTFTVGASINF